MADDYGYGNVDDVARQTSKGGKYLKIEDDHMYQLRIASEPKYVIRHWIDNRTKVVLCGGEECVYCGKDVKPNERVDKDAQWGWIVIDREDGKVKIYQGPNSVARQIKALTEIINQRTKKPSWGDPRNFDIMLKREKQTNGFYKYTVEGEPDSRVPMTDEEKKLVADAGYDLVKEMRGSKKSNNIGNYGGGDAQDLETAPADEKVDVPANLGADPDEGDERLNPDDIPF